MVNKIEAIEWQRARALARVAALREELTRTEERITYLDDARAYATSDTPVRVGDTVTCSGCGADVSTENLFSLHYVIPDPNLYNIGHCPR